MKKPDPCILCGAAEFIAIHQKHRWQYLCCQDCRLIAIHPRPTFQALMECYRNYLPDQASEIVKWKKMMAPVNHESADLIEDRTNKILCRRACYRPPASIDGNKAHVETRRFRTHPLASYDAYCKNPGAPVQKA